MAATSATVRRAQPVSVCQLGLVSNRLQPLPAPPLALLALPQTVSVQPRALVSRTRWVPPTASTVVAAAGYSTPKPLSPLLAVMRAPGGVKNWLVVVGAVGLAPPP